MKKCDTLSFEQFKEEIRNVIPEKSLYFSAMSDMYFADYKPGYPEKTSADMTISYCFVSGEAKVYGNLGSLIPTIKKIEDFDDLIDLLKQGYYI